MIKKKYNRDNIAFFKIKNVKNGCDTHTDKNFDVVKNVVLLLTYFFLHIVVLQKQHDSFNIFIFINFHSIL